VRIRKGLATGVVLSFLAVPATVYAAPGHPGDPIASTPPLSVALGPIDLDTTTTPNGQVGAPAECGPAEGASAFKIDFARETRLDLVVTELTADGLCAVSIYEDGVTSIYDPAGRAQFLELEQICDTSCTIGTRLAAGTHYLVVWPRGTGAVSRDMNLTGSIKGFPTMTGNLTGVRAGSCRRIDNGRSSTFHFDVAPTPPSSDREVTVSRRNRATGATTQVGTVLLAGNGEGSIEISGAPRGFHDVIVQFDGSETQTPRQLRRCLVVRGPSKLKIITKGERYRWADYAVWRDDDIMVFRIPVTPNPPGAKGKLNIRIERNIGNHQYKPWEVLKGVQVTDGLAVLRKKAIYRSNGLPFYRMRAEWPGSATHAPGKSPWICYQVNP
jgi:hypothetical protein